MYTQLVNDFIHDIIKKRAFVIATGNSAAFVIEACGINENAFEDLILINPESIRTFLQGSSKRNQIRSLHFEAKNHWNFYLQHSDYQKTHRKNLRR